MEKKLKKKAKRKINKVNIAAIIVSIIAVIGLLCLLAGIGLIIYLLQDKPELKLSDFDAQESSIVLDKDGEQIYELGTVIRQNVDYQDLPESLVDAFISVEDSRFFEHNGFDVPRFTKAFLSNLKTMSFSQGGSTFTMQLVKNTYFVSDEQGTGAAKSIKRKVQEIALSLQLEKESSKKEILVNYLNKLNFGGTYQNIRGIQKASQYYFGKDVDNLNLEESAMLAGVVNAPNTFNPFNSIALNDTRYLTWAQERRDEVLYLMYYHGYITENEYNLAISTKVEDFLVDSSTTVRGSNNGIAYQAYIDAVVNEVYDLTGLDPYNTPMIIHTCMDKDIQSLMDDIQAGNVNDYFEYPDSEFEVASICVDNDTGATLGILGGRNYADGGALLLNHATDQYKQPGSSIKPILDYVQAFEVLGWSTSHSLVDKPLTYVGTDYIISNATSTYAGQVTLKYAVGMSLNTPAIQAIRQLIDQKGNAYLVDYLTSMGFNIDLDDFDEQYGIGGKGLTVSCKQMAGAYAALMNNGYYTTPHTITKIEFMNEKSPVTPTYTSTQTVSEQSCFLMSELLKNDVEGGYPNLMGLFNNENYTVYAKTGTTNWGVEGEQYGVPNGSIKDGWVVACTSDYSVATWMGYEKGQVNKPSYMTYDVYNKNIKGKISKLILEKTAELYGYAEDIARPSGVSSITHIVTTFPYAAPIDGMDSKYIVSGYIRSDSKYANLVSPKSAEIEQMSSDPSIELSGSTLKISWPTYPDKDDLTIADEEMDISLVKSDGTVLRGAKGTRLFDYTWVYGPVKYKATVYVDDKEVTSVSSSDNSTTVDLTGKLKSGSKVKVSAYYGYENGSNSDSKSASTTVNDEISLTVPSSLSLDDAKKIFSPYGITVEGIPVDTTSDSDNGKTVKVTINDKNGSEIRGSKITVHQFNSNVVYVYYYSRIQYSISFNVSDQKDVTTIQVSANITPEVSDKSTLTWNVYKENGEAYSNFTTNNGQVVITDEKNSGKKYKVELKLNDGTTSSTEIQFK